MTKRIFFFFSFLFSVAQAQVINTVNDSSSISGDTVNVPSVNPMGFFKYNLIYKSRLDSIQKIVPLSYNEYVHDYIEIYSKRKEMIGKMMGLSDYYFPIFETALRAHQIPSEIKFLPIIESAMDPHAVSRVGATGLWQFMFGTAKAYGLQMDNFVDERKDPIQASYAAAAYFRDAYDELGDWLLAIAAYNCGKGNVKRAIDKANSRNFWDIRPYLPKETRNYVPALIATIYVMNHTDKHQIQLKSSELTLRTDTIHVNHFVSLSDIARALVMTEDQLFSLNPSYKKKIINGTLFAPKRLVLPKVTQDKYAQLYDVLNTDLPMNREVIMAATDDVRELRKKRDEKPVSIASFHKVAPGQNLSMIAEKYGIEVQDLKVWNKLKSATIVVGQKLKIIKSKSGGKTAQPKSKISFLTYKVKSGDTLSAIAEKYEGITVASLKQDNGLNKSTLRTGMVLKIRAL